MENNVVQRWTEVFYGRHNNLADGLPRHEEGKCFVSPETLGEEYKWGLGEEKVQHGIKVHILIPNLIGNPWIPAYLPAGRKARG